MFVSLITGTRPQIIKSAPVLRAFDEADIDYEFIHTGQHYDYNLAGVYIDEFGLKPPIDLGIGQGEPWVQLARILDKLCPHLEQVKPDYLVVPGDTTSALGATISGIKMAVPVCHLESGLRVYDLTLEEEMNRRLIDHCASGLFTPTKTATSNLSNEQVLGRVYQIGDTMYDILKARLPHLLSLKRHQETIEELGIIDNEFAVFTLHRRENVDTPRILTQIISAIKKLDFPVIFPIHPRTRKRLADIGVKIDATHIKVVEPLSYDDFIALISGSKLVISDSGGIQKECYLLNVPLVTLRNRTEWIETVQSGANVLSDLSTEDIISKCNSMYGRRLNNPPGVYGDGNASKKIPPILESGDIDVPRDLSCERYSRLLNESLLGQ